MTRKNLNLIICIFLLSVILVVYLIMPFFSTPQNISYCGSLDNNYKKDICFKKLAIHNNDLSLCAKIDAGFDKEDCLNKLYFANRYPSSVCNEFVDEEFKAKCVSDFNIYNDINYCNDKDLHSQPYCKASHYAANGELSGCEKIKEEYKVTYHMPRLDCLRDLNKNMFAFLDQKTHKFSIYLFYFVLILIFVLILTLIFLKVNKIRIINSIAFSLFPLIAISRLAFEFENFKFVAGGDANFHSVMLLLYGFFVFFVLALNLNLSFNEWREGNLDYKKRFKLTYLYAIFYSFIIPIIGTFNYLSGESMNDGNIIFSLIMKEFSILGGALFFGFFYVGAAILFAIGFISIFYTIRAWRNREGKERGFITYTTLASIIFIILGANAAFWVAVFWISGYPSAF